MDAFAVFAVVMLKYIQYLNTVYSLLDKISFQHNTSFKVLCGLTDPLPCNALVSLWHTLWCRGEA